MGVFMPSITQPHEEEEEEGESKKENKHGRHDCSIYKTKMVERTYGEWKPWLKLKVKRHLWVKVGEKGEREREREREREMRTLVRQSRH